MCGRFTLTVPSYEELATAFGVEPVPGLAETYRPRYNIAPTDPAWIVRMASHGARDLCLARWGLVPRWSRTLDQAGRPINARAETMESKPAFRDAFARRRCIVVSDGFFEWDKTAGDRKPLWFRPSHGGLLLLAGIWDQWFDVDRQERLRTFAIVTTEASPDVAAVHDRMPLVLSPSDIDPWLGAPPLDEPASVTHDVRALLAPAPKGSLVATPVSRRVGSPKNDDPSVLVPDALPPKTATQAATLPLFGDWGARRR